VPDAMYAAAPRSDEAPVGRAASAWAPMLALAISAAVLAAMYWLFVRTPDGQRVDEAARLRVGAPSGTRHLIAQVLGDVSIGMVALGLFVCVVIALLRGQRLVAASAVVLVAGANLTTQVLKNSVFSRPDYGHWTSNSLPSGHTTVVTSLVLALLLVAPAIGRGPAAFAGTAAITLTGVGTIVAAWHRPSDVIAAIAICLGWGAFMLMVIGWAHPARPRTHISHVVLAFTGTAAATLAMLAVGIRPDGSVRDLVVYIATLGGVAAATAVAIGWFVRLVDARLG